MEKKRKEKKNNFASWGWMELQIVSVAHKSAHNGRQ